MVKRIFDFILAAFLLSLFFWLLILIWIVAALSTRSSGIFMQKRVGRYGRLFTIIKFRTMTHSKGISKISPVSAFLRRNKLDELPQLLNVIAGDMSFVGPRPDVQGYYDCLEGEQRKILELRPGITSLASLKYYNEEELLRQQHDPDKYNDEVIFPDKIRLNLEYQKEQSLWLDLKIIFYTITGYGRSNDFT